MRSAGLTLLAFCLTVACTPIERGTSPTRDAPLTLAQLADLDESGRIALRREAQRTVAEAHGATSIYDTAQFTGCPTSAEALSLARIDAVSNDLTAEEARSALTNAQIAIEYLTADLTTRRFREHLTLSRSADFELASGVASEPEIANLLRRAATDQYLRGISSSVLLGTEVANAEVVESVFLRLKWPLVCTSDASNAVWLAAVLDHRTWFFRSTDGELPASAAWLLAQHADAFPAIQARVLERMQQLVLSGEVAASQYAYLTDRVGLATVGRQRFGTQMYCAGPQDWRPRPVEDPELLDQRRAEVGLPSMAEYTARGARFCTASDDDLFG